MKKSFAIWIVGVVGAMLFSCEGDHNDANPTMEVLYRESVQLSTVSVDSVKSFVSKFEEYTRVYPEIQNDSRYKQIRDNIKAAQLRMSITINDEWAGEEKIEF